MVAMHKKESVEKFTKSFHFSFAERNNWKTYCLYFLLPAGIHVIINCVLFIITAVHCNRMKRDIHRLQKGETCTSTSRRRFKILKAMFVLMFYHFSFLCLYLHIYQ